VEYEERRPRPFDRRGRVIDYTTEDFTHNGQRFDLILDTVGNPSLRRSSARW
jgi:hypothetical protein